MWTERLSNFRRLFGIDNLVKGGILTNEAGDRYQEMLAGEDVEMEHLAILQLTEFHKQYRKKLDDDREESIKKAQESRRKRVL